MGASFSSTSYTPDNLVISLDDVVSRVVTLLSGQNCVRGAVLGQITVGGQYKLSAVGAGDGSETPDGILAEDCNASTGDKEALVYFRGQFNAAAITLGATHTAETIREGLRLKGIDLIATQPR